MLGGDPVDAGGDRTMDVLFRREGRQQAFITRQVCNDPEFHLVVVGCEQRPATRWDERPAESPTLLRPNGDVVQVRPLRTEPAGACHSLAECGMNPPVGSNFCQ